MDYVKSIVLASALLLITPVCSTSCNQTIKSQCDPDNHPELCPPMLTCENNSRIECKCMTDDQLHGAVKCHQQNWESSLTLGYCITYSNSNIVHVGKCPYDLQLPSQNHSHLSLPLPCQLAELNDVICTPLNRTGTLCAHCIQGYGPGVYSLNRHCYECVGPYHGWRIYLSLELSMLTAFFCIIVCCRLSATAAAMNAFILLGQFTVGTIAYSGVSFECSIGNISSVWVRLLQVCYGFFNLDFFRGVIPPFCVSETISNTHLLALQYISALYPLCLIVITYAWIHLHDYVYNFRIVAWLWAPFHRCFARCRRTYNLKTSIIDAFATFLLLSYSKLVFVSSQIMNSVTVYAYNATADSIDTTETSYWDPTNEIFCEEHYPFAVIAITVFATFVALPPLLLLLYPTKIFQNCLAFRNWQWHALRTFVDTFQGCFKDGTQGTRDYRYFAGLYFVLRLTVFVTHALLMTSYLLSWIVPAVLIQIAAISFALCQPYKKKIFNIIDTVLLALYSTVCFLIAYIPSVQNPTALYTIILSIATIPLLYMSTYTVYIIITRTAGLQRCKPIGTMQMRSTESNSFADRILNPNNYQSQGQHYRTLCITDNSHDCEL